MNLKIMDKIRTIKLGILLLPLILFLSVMLLAFIIGGISLMQQGFEKYIIGFIVGLPFLLIIKKRKQIKGIFKKK